MAMRTLKRIFNEQRFSGDRGCDLISEASCADVCFITLGRPGCDSGLGLRILFWHVVHLQSSWMGSSDSAKGGGTRNESAQLFAHVCTVLEAFADIVRHQDSRIAVDPTQASKLSPRAAR